MESCNGKLQWKLQWKIAVFVAVESWICYNAMESWIFYDITFVAMESWICYDAMESWIFYDITFVAMESWICYLVKACLYFVKACLYVCRHGDSWACFLLSIWLVSHVKGVLTVNSTKDTLFHLTIRDDTHLVGWCDDHDDNTHSTVTIHTQQWQNHQWNQMIIDMTKYSIVHSMWWVWLSYVFFNGKWFNDSMIQWFNGQLLNDSTVNY